MGEVNNLEDLENINMRSPLEFTPNLIWCGDIY